MFASTMNAWIGTLGNFAQFILSGGCGTAWFC